MVDSDDGAIELIGDQRGDDMPDKEWEIYEPVYEKALDRYEQNSEERQAEKRKFFNDRITEFNGECPEDDTDGCWGQLFWVRHGGETNWSNYWTNISTDEKIKLLEVVKEFHGARWDKAVEAAKAKSN